MQSADTEEKQNFALLGGIEMIALVNKFFYDRVYNHSWLKLYFQNVPQKHIEGQQTDFMAGALGGPQNYRGRIVVEAHMHINITEELFRAREELLDLAFQDAKAPPELINRWKRVDNALKNKILKKSITDCQPRFKTDDLLDFKNPEFFLKPTSGSSSGSSNAA